MELSQKTNFPINQAHMSPKIEIRWNFYSEDANDNLDETEEHHTNQLVSMCKYV